MFKIIRSLIIASSLTLTTSAKDQLTKQKSSYEKFLSNRGTMITKEFYSLPPITSHSKIIAVKIAKVSTLNGVEYYLSFSAESNYNDKTAVIAENDLSEISKALISLVAYSKLEPKDFGYKEKYFITNDGFKVGIYKQDDSSMFFIDFDDYQSDDSYLFKQPEGIIESISNAILEIEKLKRSE